MSSRTVYHFFAAAVCLGLVPGCNACSSEKPYTPFGVASNLPPELPSAPAPELSPSASARASAAVRAQRKAVFVPADTHSYRLSEQRSIDVPANRHFAQVLPVDFSNDARDEAVAWLVPDADAKDAPAAELWYFPASNAPRALAALPDFVPSGPGCALRTELTQSGPKSVSVDASATCSAALVPRAPVRAVVVIAPLLEHTLLLSLRVAAPAPGEALDVKVDSSDRDGDGRDDVRVTVSVGVQNSDPAAADLVWLDRAAGPSRDTSEPKASLGRSTSRLALRARAKRQSAAAANRTGNVIRLLSALCAESGVARVFDADGNALRCGDLSNVVDALTVAQVDEALARSDLLEAFAAFDRDGWYFGHLSLGQKKALQRQLMRAVSVVELEDSSALRARPESVRGPHYSPLWFEPDTSLLVRTSAGVTRVTAQGAHEEPLTPEAGVANWPLALASESGVRISGTAHACDRSELLLTLSDVAGIPAAPIVAETLSARPASCAGHGTGPAVALSPIAFDKTGLDLIVAGTRFSTGDAARGAATRPAVPGSPRSPDGRTFILPTTLGFLLTGDTKELWTLSKLSDHAAPEKLSDCVVSNGARQVACISAGRAVLYQRPAHDAHDK